MIQNSGGKIFGEFGEVILIRQNFLSQLNRDDAMRHKDIICQISNLVFLIIARNS